MLTLDVHNHFIPMDVVDGASKGSAFDDERVEGSAGGNTTRLFKVGVPDTAGRRLSVRSMDE